MRWLRRIASLIESRKIQTFCVLISKKSWSGPDEKTDDLRDRCRYHPRVLLVAATSWRTTDVCLQTWKRHALALLLSSAWRPLPRLNSRGTDEAESRTSGK